MYVCVHENLFTQVILKKKTEWSHMIESIIIYNNEYFNQVLFINELLKNQTLELHN